MNKMRSFPWIDLILFFGFFGSCKIHMALFFVFLLLIPDVKSDVDSCSGGGYNFCCQQSQCEFGCGVISNNYTCLFKQDEIKNLTICSAEKEDCICNKNNCIEQTLKTTTPTTTTTTKITNQPPLMTKKCWTCPGNENEICAANNAKIEDCEKDNCVLMYIELEESWVIGCYSKNQYGRPNDNYPTCQKDGSVLNCICPAGVDPCNFVNLAVTKHEEIKRKRKNKASSWKSIDQKLMCALILSVFLN